MVKLLLKKQLMELFKSYFYDEKKNKMRPKWQIAAWFVFFFLVIVVMLGGMFTGISLTLCKPLTAANAGWLYFLMMSVIAIVIGAFGSVFNTYASLYLAKDNELLLSLPIPVRTIITARILIVYVMGAMYSSVVLIPALIVYWITAGITAANAVCGILLFLIVTMIVLLLSCVLGWAVAKISLRLKNKSFLTVLAALVFIGLYYFFYFKAAGMIQDLLLNAVFYGERIKGSAYFMYLFGRIGEGDLLAAIIYAVIVLILCWLVWNMIQRGFLKIAASGGSTEKVRYTEKAVKEKSVFSALLFKELGRFTSSANYMLNCGMGILFLIGAGVLLLFKGSEYIGVLDQVFVKQPGASTVLVCTMLCMCSSMIDMAVPSVSLEGKSIWIPQSLPVTAKQVLHAKMSVQLLLSGIPMLFASVCAASVMHVTAAERVLVVLMPVIYSVFSAVCGMVIGVRMPILSWTNELAPIKQSGAVGIILFGSWAVTIAIAGIYMLLAYPIGAVPYLLILTGLLAAVSAYLQHWLDKEGASLFASL